MSYVVALAGLMWLGYWYLGRLPIAPACPTCRSVTRGREWDWPGLDLLPRFADTFVGECLRCGWRGRMRWRWAERPVPRGGR